MRTLWMILVLVMASALVPLGAAIPQERPPVVQEGVDRCALCNMIIRDSRHAAVLVSAAHFRFDDIGCLLNFLHAHPMGERELKALLIRDWESQRWIEARRAFFVLTSLRTPMTYGLFAFKQPQSAESFAKAQGGKVLTFQEAMTYAVERRKMKMGH